MKKILIAFIVAGSALSMVVADAEARRMGGGGSFGRQSPNVTRQATPPQQTPAQQQNQMANPGQPNQAAAPGAQAGARPAAPASPWRNILGGALLGLGLGALLAHLGITGALANIIGTVLMIALLALAAMFIYRMIRGKTQPRHSRPAFAGGYSPDSASTPEIGSGLNPRSRPAAFQTEHLATGGAAIQQSWGVPADFEVDPFLRSAKTYFVRLQDAWDRGDINDIREFTTPEMFAELRLQLQERGALANHTDVVALDAELLGIESVGDDHVASVRFSGLIKESETAQPEPFTEVWNLAKPDSGRGGWVLAGIQQLSKA